MIRGIFYFLLLIAAIFLGIKIHEDPGLVFIRYQGWILETSLWFFILSLFLLGFVLFLLLKLLARILNMPRMISKWFKKHSQEKALQETLEGFAYLLQRNAGQAEKFCLKAAEQEQMPFMNYLFSAQAANLKGNLEKRKKYIQQANRYALDAQLKIALKFAEIEYALEEKKWLEALNLVLPLYQKQPKNPFLLQSLKRIYLKQGHWEALFKILPQLKNLLSEKQQQILENLVGIKLLKEVIKHSEGIEAFNAQWKRLSKSIQNQPKVFIVYLDGLLHYGLRKKAEKLLLTAIKERPDAILEDYYSGFEHQNSSLV
jgi:heme biosynthesis-associated TPR repeat protein